MQEGPEDAGLLDPSDLVEKAVREEGSAGEEGQSNPTLLGVVESDLGESRSFPQISLLPGHDLCSCHENPFFVYDAQRFDCFDPWHQYTAMTCVKMCRC